jgi:phosphatidylethanolamine-binding protein (PEBP) family uncharacterized protein
VGALGALQHPAGLNGTAGIRGRDAPPGRHRYFHKLYALDVVLPDLRQPTKAALLEAMQGHVMEEAELIGTYEKD